jgi:hypothetical protein
VALLSTENPSPSGSSEIIIVVIGGTGVADHSNATDADAAPGWYFDHIVALLWTVSGATRCNTDTDTDGDADANADDAQPTPLDRHGASSARRPERRTRGIARQRPRYGPSSTASTSRSRNSTGGCFGSSARHRGDNSVGERRGLHHHASGTAGGNTAFYKTPPRRNNAALCITPSGDGATSSNWPIRNVSFAATRAQKEQRYA